MLGRGRAVAIVQFIKGAWSTGERLAFTRFDNLLTWHSMGEGFTWETQDRARDIAACARAWDEARAQMARPEVSLVVLDELCIALRYEYLDVAEVVGTLATRRPGLHVVVTGRNAPAALVEAADLVTEMQAIKHPFKAGVKAQEGIEF
jgi:cob(I)alamin adenosyltransferase